MAGNTRTEKLVEMSVCDEWLKGISEIMAYSRIGSRANMKDAIMHNLPAFVWYGCYYAHKAHVDAHLLTISRRGAKTFDEAAAKAE